MAFKGFGEVPPMSDSHPGRTVLLVEDEAYVRTILTLALERAGVRVVAAPGGHAAAELLRAEPGVHAALLDVRMPGLDGPQTLTLLRAIRPSLRCCFLTGDHDPQRVLELLALGGDAVIGKPFSLADLVQAVRLLLGDAEEQRSPT
jgi:DNA-binding response OmpR family regulator